MLERRPVLVRLFAQNAHLMFLKYVEITSRVLAIVFLNSKVFMGVYLTSKSSCAVITLNNLRFYYHYNKPPYIWRKLFPEFILFWYPTKWIRGYLTHWEMCYLRNDKLIFLSFALIERSDIMFASLYLLLLFSSL